MDADRNEVDEPASGEPGSNMSVTARRLSQSMSRRQLFKVAVGVGVGIAAVDALGAVSAQQATDTEPASMPPQKGDWFVFADGTKKGQIIKADDVPLGGPQVLAWPAEVSNKASADGSAPTIEVVRNGNSQNEVLLARFDESDYSPSTKGYTTATGVVAYAATCTHQCCVVSDWNADAKLFHCPCHGSEYDPLNGAKETPTSPAPRPLPQLPLAAAEEDDSIPTVASGFRTRVGCGPIRH